MLLGGPEKQFYQKPNHWFKKEESYKIAALRDAGTIKRPGADGRRQAKLTSLQAGVGFLLVPPVSGRHWTATGALK